MLLKLTRYGTKKVIFVNPLHLMATGLDQDYQPTVILTGGLIYSVNETPEQIAEMLKE